MHIPLHAIYAPPTLAALTQGAADALRRYCSTRTDAAHEVGTTKRTARILFPGDRDLAAGALLVLAAHERLTPAQREEVTDMAAAVRDGYAEEGWTLRLARFAAEASARPMGPGHG